jgi:hypothetical protein
MGLAERRAAKEFQANELPKLQTEVNDAAGFSVPIEAHWDEMSPEGESQLYKESWTAVYFEPLIAALKDVTRDDMGREALKEGLRRIVIRNSDGNGNSDYWAKFEENTLTLDHRPTETGGDMQGRTTRLIQVLESGL